MKATNRANARLFVLTFALTLMLAGCICLACEHGAHCCDPMCPICQLLEPSARLGVAPFAVLAIPAVFIVRRPDWGMFRQSVSLVCFRVRLDD